MTNEFGVEVEPLSRLSDESPYAYVVYCPHWNEVLTPSAYFRCMAAANKDDFFGRVRAEVSEAAKLWAVQEAKEVKSVEIWDSDSGNLIVDFSNEAEAEVAIRAARTNRPKVLKLSEVESGGS